MGAMVIFNKVDEHILFRIALVVKIIEGFFELIGGILLMFVSSAQIVDFVTYLFRPELVEDSKDWVANFFIHAAQQLSVGILTFIIISLIAYGIINILLASALWKEKRWAFPVAGILISILVIYQIIRMSLSFSVYIFVLILIDVVILILLRNEYLNFVAKHKN